MIDNFVKEAHVTNLSMDSNCYAALFSAQKLYLANCNIAPTTFLSAAGNTNAQYVETVNCDFSTLYFRGPIPTGAKILGGSIVPLPGDAGAIAFSQAAASALSNFNVSNVTFNTTQSPHWIESTNTVTLANSIFSNNLITGGPSSILNVSQATPPTWILSNNLGYNPLGHITSPPGVPATTVFVANNTGVHETVFVSTGSSVTVSAIKIGGTAGTSTGGTATGVTVAASSTSSGIPLPAGQTIALTYSGSTPTWKWFGG